MVTLESEDPKSESQEPEEPSKGPSLTVIYIAIAVAMLLATVIAAIIVLPFYLRR